MATLHGSWIVQSQESYLFIWGEKWRSQTEDILKDLPSAPHPFCLNQQELSEQLQGYKIDSKQGIKASTKVRLPSKAVKRKTQVIPLLANTLLQEAVAKSSIIDFTWEVQGLRFSALDSLQILGQLPLNILEEKSTIGQDLRYWTHVYRWVLDLVTRGKFLPHFNPQKQKSYWYPVLDSTVDQTRLAHFNQHIPPACYAYQLDTEESQSQDQFNASQQVLFDFLAEGLNVQVRTWIDEFAISSKTTLIQPWLASLSHLSGELQLKQKTAKRLENALYNWTLSLQNYVVSPQNKQLGNNQFRLGLVLEPPSSEAIEKGQLDWILSYHLQALDNSAFLVSAETIFNHPETDLMINQRTLENAQDLLLKGLGLASRLYAPIADSLDQNIPYHCILDPIKVYEFLRSSAQQLQNNGLGVILPPSLASGTTEKRLGVKLQAEVKLKKGEHLSLKSLLKYDLKLSIGEQELSEKDFNKLLKQQSPLVEINGEWTALQPSDVKAAQSILDQSYQAEQLSVEDGLRLKVGEIQTLAKLPVVQFEASGVLQELLNHLTNNEGIEAIEQPEGFNGTLRPYQRRGVGWLAFLEKWGLGACLADDMGLGKTLQLLGFLLHLKANNQLNHPTLIICPTSVINNWQREAQKFTPDLSVLIHHGSNRNSGKTFLKIAEENDIIITSYALVYRDLKSLEAVSWQGLVLDEAQNIKNAQAKQSQAVRQINAGFRIALTGTPVENRLTELWSILDFLNPNFLGTKTFFQKRFATPIEKYGDQTSLLRLRSLVRPFILRRLKTDKMIIQDLPEKQEMTVFCGLSQEQAKLYQMLVDQSLAAINESEGIQRHGLILTLLMKLKQICNHPDHFNKEKLLTKNNNSGKLLRLEAMLEELIEEGDRALIFTQFSEWGNLLKPYLEQKFKQDVFFLYGATRREQRQAMVDRFQNDPDAPQLFILSLKAGGTGLNLTRANHVFHIDRWWNPAVENQATDRAFRIGQKQNVQVHKFVCSGTLEEKINDIIESKQQLAEQTVDAGENWLTQLDTQQLRNLLLLDRDRIMDGG
ncbi:MAG: DEAD/DEAH box helicase [Microcystaceae cyanobacterium]